ncbi:MAG: hypothetical protein ACFUZC_00995 [Chthoniobacteraceae bacterium]
MSRQGLMVICVLVLAASVWFYKPPKPSSDESSQPAPEPAAATAPVATPASALRPSASPLSLNRPAVPQVPQVPYVKGRILYGVNSAKSGERVVMRLDSAFSLSQIEAAKAKAIREHKPLGFIMVWGQFFDSKAVDSRAQGGGEGLAHFYRAFRNTLVLVYVRHESELGQVPDAVKKGFNGPDEGGFAPNMAVVDATASEFIVEIPYGGAKSTGEIRDGVFSAGAQKIEQWLSTHPDALTQTPAKR